MPDKLPAVVPSSGDAEGEPAQGSERTPSRLTLTRRALLWQPVGIAAGVALGRVWSALEPPRSGKYEDPGQLYQISSKLSAPGIPDLTASASGILSPAVIHLPPVPPTANLTLEQAIRARRSIRDYADRPLSLEQLSRLLYYGDGVTDRSNPAAPLRAAPSAGALYPLDSYVVALAVRDLDPAVYRYDVDGHALAMVRPGDVREYLFRAVASQQLVLGAAALVVLTGLFSRIRGKYGARSYRYMLLEAGHISENIYLTATALGLGVCGLGAFLDDELNRLLGVDGQDETALFAIAVGPR